MPTKKSKTSKMKYPWGQVSYVNKRDAWLRENDLQDVWKDLLESAKEMGLLGLDGVAWASDQVTEQWDAVKNEEEKESAENRLPQKEDWYWAFKHYGDDVVDQKDAPSMFAWSLLLGAKKDNSCWRNLQDKVGKDLFGTEVDEDDDRAFIATGMPSALRERFSSVLGEAKRVLSGDLPRVFGRTEGA